MADPVAATKGAVSSITGLVKKAFLPGLLIAGATTLAAPAVAGAGLTAGFSVAAQNVSTVATGALEWVQSFNFG